MSIEMAALCGAAFAAGLVDAVAGGGGLIQIPALLLLLPPDLASNIALVLGTNKVSSTCGTAVAVWRYDRHLDLPWRILAPAMAAAFACAFLGARTVSLIPPGALRPIVLVLLVGVAVWTTFQKDNAASRAPAPIAGRSMGVVILFAAAMGFYDGIFGPGTGSFLTAGFVVWLGCDFLHATGSAKVINLATNLGALACFIGASQVSWAHALPMAACNVAGALVGAELAVSKGSTFVRRLFLAVTTVLIAKVGWDLFRG